MDIWEKIKTVSTTISIIIIPIVIVFIGNLYSKTTKEKEVQGKFVELSVQILKEQPSKDNQNIRKWATDVINEYSGVKLDTATISDLIMTIPITENENKPIMNNDILKISAEKKDLPVDVKVQFFGNIVSTYTIRVLGKDNKEIATQDFAGPNSLNNTFKLPKFSNENKSLFVNIDGIATNIESENQTISIIVKFEQNNQVIWHKEFSFVIAAKGNSQVFSSTTIVFLDDAM